MYTYIVCVYIYIHVLQVPEFRGENQISHSTQELVGNQTQVLPTEPYLPSLKKGFLMPTSPFPFSLLWALNVFTNLEKVWNQ